MKEEERERGRHRERKRGTEAERGRESEGERQTEGEKERKRGIERERVSERAHASIPCRAISQHEAGLSVRPIAPIPKQMAPTFPEPSHCPRAASQERSCA